MNALAFDQARRIAKVIHDAPALRGKVGAGLYVGEREKAPHTTLGREHLVTGRETLRERPPHILLTNHKMLDFLMIRPAGLLNGLCALISAVRERDESGDAKLFLQVGLHLWVRELRRMVCWVAVSADISPKTESPPMSLKPAPMPPRWWRDDPAAKSRLRSRPPHCYAPSPGAA